MAVGSKKERTMNAGLELHGSRPGSAEPPRGQFDTTFNVPTPTTPTRKSQSRYHERLFSGPGTQTYSTNGPSTPLNSTYNRSRSESPVTPNKRQSSGSPRPHTPKRGATPTKPSYIDEALFGDRLEEPSFAAPWDDGKKPVFVMDATDYKMQNKLREQRERNAREQTGKKKGSPMVASHTIVKSSHKFRPKYRPSEVDEMLFGSDQNRGEGVSWEARASPSPSHDPLNTGRLSVAGSRAPSREGRPPSPGRPVSGRSPSPVGRPGSSLNKHKPRHSPSYIDESLFGPRPVEPDFPAPWENREEERRRGRPLLFDARDYRVVIDHGRPESGRSRNRPRSSSARRTSDKPAWR